MGLDLDVPINRRGRFRIKTLGGPESENMLRLFVELVDVIPTLFMERQNSVWFRRYDKLNFRGS